VAKIANVANTHAANHTLPVEHSNRRRDDSKRGCKVQLAETDHPSNPRGRSHPGDEHDDALLDPSRRTAAIHLVGTTVLELTGRSHRGRLTPESKPTALPKPAVETHVGDHKLAA